MVRSAELLELSRLPGGGAGASYAPSRNRQSHLWAFSERADARSIALKRVFLRCGRQDAAVLGVRVVASVSCLAVMVWPFIVIVFIISMRCHGCVCTSSLLLLKP